MTLEEFSDRFDVMVNSYSVKSIAGDLTFDEYEKSVFLSKAQDDMIISLYNGKNGYADSYESSEEIRRYLANFVVSTYKTPITNSNDIPLGVGSTSKFFTLPEDVWFIVYESVNVDNVNPAKRNVKVLETKCARGGQNEMFKMLGTRGVDAQFLDSFGGDF